MTPQRAGSSRGPEEELASQLVGIARQLIVPGSVDQTLARIAHLAAAVIDGRPEAGLCGAGLAAANNVQTGPLVAAFERLQVTTGEGPCPDVMGGQDLVEVTDLAADRRWPTMAPLATAAGVRSVLAYALSDGREVLGALLICSPLPEAFGDRERAYGLIFALHSGWALGAMRDRSADLERVENLHQALASREVIGQAQGILMERERITGAQAFERLRDASQRLNVKLRDVAQELVDTGVITAPADLPRLRHADGK